MNRSSQLDISIDIVCQIRLLDYKLKYLYKTKKILILKYSTQNSQYEYTQKKYIESNISVKTDTNQLQYSLKTDTCPACPCVKSDSSAQLAWCCSVSFCTTEQCRFLHYTQSAGGFHIIVLNLTFEIIL